MSARGLLYVTDLTALTDGELAFLRDRVGYYDALVVAVASCERAWEAGFADTCGERIARATPSLRALGARALYVLPVPSLGLSPAMLATRFGLYVPPVTDAVLHEPAWAEAFVRANGWRVLDGPWRDGVSVLPPEAPAARRGLFVTRAQLFHNGHRAFVRQMAEAEQEVVVVIAKANVSHRPTDPATAGERAEMVRASLERECPGRYHLVAAPYLDDDGANMAALGRLVPAFQTVYTNSPSTAAMARDEGFAVASLETKVDASGTELRRRIVANERWQEMVPDEVRAVLERSPALARLRALGERETR